jgi:hypothetical protein
LLAHHREDRHVAVHGHLRSARAGFCSSATQYRQAEA